MSITATLTPLIQQAFSVIHPSQVLTDAQIQFQQTRKEFKGDITLVVFPIAKTAGKSPDEVAMSIGEFLKEHSPLIVGFNVVKGFLNLEVHEAYFVSQFNAIIHQPDYGQWKPAQPKTIMVEYSSPNTNKPLHLGHLRNNFLGYSVAEILKANGHRVHKVQIINDRGIHICKSMVAWRRYGNGETPASSGLKGDKLVGKYYVIFDQQYKAEINEAIASGQSKEWAEKNAPILLEAQEMLRQWEEQHLAGNGVVLDLWKTMNGWVYQGFEQTYREMGVDFDQLYYESDTYLLGKEEVLKGLEKGVFFQKEDGSVWVDLTPDGLDEKLLLRGDGTAVYMTQDIGTAILRYKDQPELSQLIYTVGNEQDYHFKVLFLILQKLGFEWAKECHHLSYGMVDLPTGKMKSREGTVVDADDLMAEMRDTARQISGENGKFEDATEQERNILFDQLGKGALKYFLLKVDPKKRMLFNPAESIDFAGHTGPFIQYTHARIRSIIRKSNQELHALPEHIHLNASERDVIKTLLKFPDIIAEAGSTYSPAVLANYLFELAKDFNQLYQTTPILKEADPALLSLRLQICRLTAQVIQRGTALLGIEAPERM